jgi:poly(3-hydroxybutyrate) depolymerase
MLSVSHLHGPAFTVAEKECLIGKSTNGSKEGILVVCRQVLGTPAIWHAGPGPQGDADFVFLGSAIFFLRERLNGDSMRIYATGLSNGRAMAAQGMAGKIAAEGNRSWIQKN